MTTKRMLSEFRDHLKPSGFGKIAQLLASDFLNVVPLPEIKVAIPDATDMPANCNGFAKKNVSVLGNANAQRSTQPRDQQKANGQRRVGEGGERATAIAGTPPKFFPKIMEFMPFPLEAKLHGINVVIVPLEVEDFTDHPGKEGSLSK